MTSDFVKKPPHPKGCVLRANIAPWLSDLASGQRDGHVVVSAGPHVGEQHRLGERAFEKAMT